MDAEHIHDPVDKAVYGRRVRDLVDLLIYFLFHLLFYLITDPGSNLISRLAVRRLETIVHVFTLTGSLLVILLVCRIILILELIRTLALHVNSCRINLAEDLQNIILIDGMYLSQNTETYDMVAAIKVNRCF